MNSILILHLMVQFSRNWTYRLKFRRKLWTGDISLGSPQSVGQWLSTLVYTLESHGRASKKTDAQTLPQAK